LKYALIGLWNINGHKVAGMTAYTVDRRLSPFEKFFWLIDKENRINFLMHAAVRGTLSENSLRTALKTIQARHPLLRVRIVKEGRSEARFISHGVSGIPLRVLEEPLGEWVKVAEEELNANFASEEGPLVRAALVRHTGGLSTLLLTFHHAIGDGDSGAYLMRDLLQAASLSERGKDPSLPPLPAKKELEAYLPDWVKGPRGRWRYWQYWGRVAAPIVRYGRPVNLRIDKKAPLIQRRAHIIARTLGPEIVRELSERARREGTTVHGALASAVILALTGERSSTGKGLYMVASPVNLRLRLSPPLGEDVGVFVTIGISSGLAGQSTEFWPLAREVRNSLSQCVERGYPFVWIYQHKDLNLAMSLLGTGQWGQHIYARLAQMTNPGVWGLSNIGRVQVCAHQGPFAVESFGFAGSGSVWYRFAAFVATFEDRLSWNFVGMEPIHTREHTRRVADVALETLARAIEGGRKRDPG
jgi:hypothetical protein